MGLEDANLLNLIKQLESIQKGHDGGCGISNGELALLEAMWERLELITRP